MPDGVFPVEVVTPEASLVETTARAVVLRSSDGDLTVLDGHTALVTDVVSGEVRIDQEDESVLRLAAHGGFLQVDTSHGAVEEAGAPAGLSTRMTMLFGVAERSEDIDVERAQRAREAAQAQVEELQAAGARAGAEPAEEGAALTPEQVALVAAEAALRRAEVRLQVAGEATS
ncbi:MAG TPA: hypothetical protein VK277_11250 [Acidimicrobiales bacterium]|nr:hypothetical protein [Acidimicrobiales bacterium]